MGSRLFGRPNHDADAVARAFAPEASAEDKAKGGEAIEPGSGAVPLAGFFAGGEIGPVGGESFLHGHTACLAMQLCGTAPKMEEAGEQACCAPSGCCC